LRVYFRGTIDLGIVDKVASIQKRMKLKLAAELLDAL